MKERKVSLIFFYDEKKRILLQDRKFISKHGEEWGFFGGGIKEGETPAEAIVREVKEELDFDLKEFTQITYFKNIAEDLGRVFHTHIFFAPLKDNLKEFKQQEGKNMNLFTIKEAMKLKILKCDDKLLKIVKDKL